MDGTLRNATPLVLLVLAALAWFEPWLPSGLRGTFGEVGVLRVVTGLLAVYLTMLVLERQRMESLFKQVLGELRAFQQQLKSGAAAGSGGAGAGGSGVDAAQADQALEILAAALSSKDPEVRRAAAENLQRLSGQDFGEDQAAWQSWLQTRRTSDAPSGRGPRR